MPTATLVSSKNMLELTKLWHLRLEHAPFSKLQVLFLEISAKTIKDSLICAICPASRQHRLPIHDSFIKTSNVFDLLRLDIWGPYPYKTHNDCNFFLTIVDDFSRITW